MSSFLVKEMPKSTNTLMDKIITDSELTFYIKNIDHENQQVVLVLNTNSILVNNQNPIIRRIQIDFHNLDIKDIVLVSSIFKYPHLSGVLI